LGVRDQGESETWTLNLSPYTLTAYGEKTVGIVRKRQNVRESVWEEKCVRAKEQQ